MNKVDKIIELLRQDTSVDAPRESIEWVKHLFAVRSMRRRPSIVQRLVAHLDRQIMPGTLVYGERSASASSVQQMLFIAGEIGIDIRLTQKTRECDIRGQVLGTNFESGTVTLISCEAKELTVQIENGTFSFSGIRPGEYQLTISDGSVEIVTESFSTSNC